jgi:hypothetical protein
MDIWMWLVTGGVAIVVVEVFLVDRERRLLLLDPHRCRLSYSESMTGAPRYRMVYARGKAASS